MKAKYLLSLALLTLSGFVASGQSYCFNPAKNEI